MDLRIGASFRWPACLAAQPRHEDLNAKIVSPWRTLAGRPVDAGVEDLGSVLGFKMRIVKSRPSIAVVDDDESVRESLPDLLRELGYEARAFASAEEFLDSGCLGQMDCLILDIAMAGMSGPELQRDLLRQGKKVPIVFITAQRDARLQKDLLRKGAVEVLFKPFSEQNLREVLDLALGQL